MEIDYEKAILTLFGIGIFGAIFFMIVAAFLHHSPSRQNKVKSLNEKNKVCTKELYEILIKQIHCLNEMLQNGAISSINYDFERLKIIQTFYQYEMDTSVIANISKPMAPNIKSMIHKKLILSSELNNKGGMGDDELNDNINESLDDLKKID